MTPNASTNPYGLFLRQLSVSYTPDIWGENRRAVESLEAQTDQQRYQLEAAYLALTSNVAAAAVQEASLRGQIAATREVIKVEQNLLSLLRQQYALGSVSQADVLTQEAALAQVMQLLPPLEKALAQQRDLLTALAGQYSTAQVPETFHLNSLTLPRDLPVTLPSRFVRQRPDVRAAEANMHSASAQIGVALAARLPNITLSTNNGYTAYSYAQFSCRNGVLHAGGRRHAAAVRRLHAAQQTKGGGSGPHASRGPISAGGHHRLPERRGRAARAAGGRQGGQGRGLCRAGGQEKPRNREEAVAGGLGQCARHVERGTDIFARGGVPRPGRGQSSFRYRRPCSWRLAATGRIKT